MLANVVATATAAAAAAAAAAAGALRVATLALNTWPYTLRADIAILARHATATIAV